MNQDQRRLVRNKSSSIEVISLYSSHKQFTYTFANVKEPLLLSYNLLHEVHCQRMYLDGDLTNVLHSLLNGR